MTKAERTTRAGARYTYYANKLRSAEQPSATFTGIALSIGKCKEYTKAEKGQALETLTAVWMDFIENG